jgi:hypothetical protein
MTDREIALQSLSVGDIFNAEHKGGPRRPCVVVEVTAAAIIARSITTQNVFAFDRRTGIAVHELFGSTYHWAINSVAALPPDIHEVMVEIDRKGMARARRRANDPTYKTPPEELALTEDEIRAMLFIADFHRANPI